MLEDVQVAPLTPFRFRSVLAPAQADTFDEVVARGREEFAGRVVWNVNSTANGGGVAEMLRSLIAYARGAEIDARWVVIEGSPAFFRLTKRIHNRLHGAPGDGGRLGARERATYDAIMRANVDNLVPPVAPGDLVLLHDPQTAGMAGPLVAAGAHVVWRCHVGLDDSNRLARSAWGFLRPYVEQADAYVFSREAFVWDELDRKKIAIIPPSIDAFSPKNQPMTQAAGAAILRTIGLAGGPARRPGRYTRLDGTPGRVDRSARLWQDDLLPADVAAVVHVSRWDRLKDPVGTIAAFEQYVVPAGDAHLVLAGPDVAAVADDPEGLDVLNECVSRWSALAPDVRRRVHLVALPMGDADENAAMVNALQRRATVVVQKSLAEGFGLTVAEGMWKAKPVVASRIGGIQNQIVDGESGLLVTPSDLEGFGAAIVSLLADPALARAMGSAAQERVRDWFLGPRHLAQYLDLFTRVLEEGGAQTASAARR